MRWMDGYDGPSDELDATGRDTAVGRLDSDSVGGTESGTSAAVTVWLLVGLTGSGKTTYAERLEGRGVVRLSVDEEVYARHGRYGVDYHESEYFVKEAPVVEEVYRWLVELVRTVRDVVLDRGLWRRADRDAAKELVEAAGGRWRLIYFEVSRAELLRRLEIRNRRADANALMVTPEALDDFIARFEEPSGEGEEVINGPAGVSLAGDHGMSTEHSGR